jgi:hypothetical protein
VTTIADCKVVANLIVEEWLVRDNATASGSRRRSARSLRPPRRTGGDQPATLARERSRHRTRSDVEIEAGHPAIPLAAMLRSASSSDLMGTRPRAVPCAETRWPSRRHGFGRGSGSAA